MTVTNPQGYANEQITKHGYCRVRYTGAVSQNGVLVKKPGSTLSVFTFIGYKTDSAISVAFGQERWHPSISPRDIDRMSAFVKYTL